MGLAELVETYIQAEAARDAAAREVAEEMKRLGIDRAMLPGLQAIIHIEDLTAENPAVWAETDVVIAR